MATNFFPLRPESQPMIYAYKENNPRLAGLLKVGYTSVDVERRIAQQFPTLRPGGKPYEIVFQEPAMRADGSTFLDHEIHRHLRKMGLPNPDGEWFQCTLNDLQAAYIAVKERTENKERRSLSFAMRPEQEDAVSKTINYYEAAKREFPDRSPRFLWNAKMRFGKMFASFQLAKKLQCKKVLVLTFKPAVESAWEDDLLMHIDFAGWQFISRNSELQFEQIDATRPLVCFGSFQDYLGTNKNGGIKANNEWVHSTNWDLVIFDEYHFGAWRDNASKLFEFDEDSFDNLDLEKYKKEEAGDAINESFLPITTDYYLFLSGTPFRALNSGEFIEDQIYNWTYADEQRAKERWGADPNNPYESLPRMLMLTYRLPEDVTRIALQGEFNEFDLNVFFSARGSGDKAEFVYKDYVQKWLNLIRGAHLPAATDDLKLGAHRPPLPYSDANLLSILTHTLWFLPDVASCSAMKNLLQERQNIFFHEYTVNVCAGPQAGIGLAALAPVQKSMSNPLQTKTITLSCGKLTTGVTIKPWSGIFMLRNLSSPETYFQAAFRVQSPWVIEVEGSSKQILKKECYVFDFALDRALKQIADYSCSLNVNEENPEVKVGEFIRFLPVLAYDGSGMRQIDPSEVLDIALAGTSATLLAKRWESALLVNVDNDTLARLIANQQALDALMSIEGFRSLNGDIQTIINKSTVVKKARMASDERLTPAQKRELNAAEKEYKSLRKAIQEKLIKFATRIPIFMYLTDRREYSLKDVITQLEPALFKKVTGLNTNDFELLVSLGVFNGPLMNDAVYKFKRYEDSSLSYTGVDRHEGEAVGLWDTVISNEEFMLLLQRESMVVTRSENMGAAELRGNSLSATEGVEPSAAVAASENAPLIHKADNKHSAIASLKQNYGDGHKAVTQSAELLQAAEPNAIDPREINIAVGSLVYHRRFGAGEVIELDESRGIVTVKMGAAEKRFQYPQSFIAGFLKKA